MGKVMKMAMLDSQRRKNYDNGYSRNQIGFRKEPEYYPHTNKEHWQDDWSMEYEPPYNGGRRRDSKGRYMEYEDTRNMHYGQEKEYSEPMMGYLGIAYSVEGGKAKMSRQKAEDWTQHMKNEDGSHGAKWSFDEVRKVMQQHGVECDPVEFFATMNMLYSDYGEVFKKHDVATVSFYVDMAKAFLEDEDAVKDKLEKYYMYVVKH